ncbi:hypothetical protein D3C84_1299870 [compost metagenome]
MADPHARLVQPLHPGRRDRGLSFGEAADQGDLEFLARYAVDGGLQLAAQCRINRHAGFGTQPEELLQFAEQP